MAKSTKARKHKANGVDLNTQGTTLPNDLHERLKRIENVRANNSSSQVFKFVFFFLMGVVLTVIIYPAVSRAIRASIQDDDTAVETTVTSNKTKRQEVGDYFNELDNDEFENIDDTLRNRNGDKHHINMEKIEETSNVNTKEEVNGEKNAEHQKETHKERIVLQTIDASDLMMEEELNVEENKLDTHPHSGNTILESKTRHTNDIPNKSEGDDTKTHSSKQTKRPVSQRKEKPKANEVKMNMTNTDSNKKTETNEDAMNQHDQANEKELPKEIREFKRTTLTGVVTKKIFADGRRIPPVELLPQKPNNSSVRVWMFDDFLSDAECDGLIRVHDQHVEDQNKLHPLLCFDSVSTLRKHLRSVGKKTNVTPRDFTPGTTCVNTTFSRQLREWLHGNWSYSTAFYSGESRFASIFEHRVKEATGLTPENGGKFQITSYPDGIGYKAHTDCTEDSTDKRDRVATVMIYLNTVEDGGRTEFPEMGIWAKPRKGRAMVWNNMNEKGECEPMSIHKAAKTVSGHKYILLRWYYYQSFYSLGKRPPEPHLPKREPGQPRVSCDQFEHGSCRWYDEWNFDHMIEYERQKYTLV